jgi:hypothetical protein
MAEADDLRKWKQCVYNDIKAGQPLRTKFASQAIRPEVHQEIAEALKYAKTKFEAKLVFDKHLDPELKASMTLLKYARELRELERDVATP